MYGRCRLGSDVTRSGNTRCGVSQSCDFAIESVLTQHVYALRASYSCHHNYTNKSARNAPITEIVCIPHTGEPTKEKPLLYRTVTPQSTGKALRQISDSCHLNLPLRSAGLLRGIERSYISVLASCGQDIAGHVRPQSSRFVKRLALISSL